MIIRDYNIHEFDLHYFVGINQIKVNHESLINYNNENNYQKESPLKLFFNLIERIQNKFENSIVQVIKYKYVLNPETSFVWPSLSLLYIIVQIL